MTRPFLLALCLLASSAHAQSTSALDGVYMGLRQSGITGSLYPDYWTFRPDGVVIDEFPTEGLDRPIDVEYTCALYLCGRYTRAGSALQIQWDHDAAPRTYALDADGAFNEVGKTGKYRPLRPLDGLRLDATFAVDNPETGTTLVSLTLTADGRFQEQNLMGWTAWAQLGLPDEAREALPGGQGTYTVRRNTLALHYDTGLTAYFFVVVPPGIADVPTTNVLYVNTSPLDRRTSTAVQAPAPVAGVSVSSLFPSPADAHTAVRIAVPTSQQVRVGVYTLLGQEVQTVFDGLVQPGPATAIPLDTRGLPAGAYALRVMGTGRPVTRLLTVVH